MVPGSLGDVQRLFTVGRQRDGITELFERFAINVANRLVVIDQQNALRSNARFGRRW